MLSCSPSKVVSRTTKSILANKIEAAVLPLALLGLLAISGVATAGTGEMLSCQGTQGATVQKCMLNGQELLAAQATESDFLVSYQMTCNRGFSGPKPTKIYFKLENDQQLMVELNSSVSNVRVGTGMGPLSIVDTKPSDLKNLAFNSCSLVVTEVKAQKSARVIALEEAAKSEQRNALAEYLNQTQEQVRFNRSLLMSEQSNLYFRTGQKLEMACLVKTWQGDPLYSEIVADMINKYESLYGPFQNESVNCEEKAFVQVTSAGMSCAVFNTEGLTSMLANKDLPAANRLFFESCLSELNYSKVLNWFTNKAAELEMKISIVASQGQSDLSNELSNLRFEVSQIVASSCTSTSCQTKVIPINLDK